jgi:hypothetical protein
MLVISVYDQLARTIVTISGMSCANGRAASGHTACLGFPGLPLLLANSGRKTNPSQNANYREKYFEYDYRN